MSQTRMNVNTNDKRCSASGAASSHATPGALQATTLHYNNNHTFKNLHSFSHPTLRRPLPLQLTNNALLQTPTEVHVPSKEVNA